MTAANSDIVAALYDGIVDDARLDKALTLLAVKFDSPSISLLSLDLAAPAAETWAAHGIFARQETLAAYRETFAALDPAPAAFAQSPALSATTTNTMIAQGRIDESDPRTRTFLNEYYRQSGLEECLGANLSSRNGHTALIGIHRGSDRRAYTADDIRELEALTPHLARALQLRRVFVNLALEASLLAEVIDRLPAGIIILDADGKAVHCNRAALEITARSDGLAIDRAGIPYSTANGAGQQVERLCAGIRSGGTGGVMRIARKQGGPPYAILVSPIPVCSPLGLPRSAQPHILMVIHDPSASIDASAELIVAAFGLPLRAAELVLALAQGEEAAAFAKRRGIGMNTVKFHLKTAFARTGFRRQSDLIRTVTRAIGELGRRRK